MLGDFKNLELFIDFLNEKNLSRNSIAAYRRDINSFLNWITIVQSDNHLMPNDIVNNRNILIEYMEYCRQNNLAQATLQRRVQTLNQWINFQRNEMNIQWNPVIPQIKKERKDLTIIDHSMMQLILKQISANNFHNVRLKAIINMLYSTGLRVSELIQIKMNDIKDVLENHEKSFRIIGKGNKERQVFMTHDAVESLQAYIKMRKGSSIYLWNNETNHITRQAVFLWLQKLNVAPHDFRHKLASDLVRNGMNLLEVKKIMGHSSVKTTSLYTHAIDPEIEIKKYHPLHNKINKI